MGTLWESYLSKAAVTTIWPNNLIPYIVAQGMIESARGTTDLAKFAYNFHAMKWNKELGTFYPSGYYYQGYNYFNLFPYMLTEFACYWKLIHRSPYYDGVDQHLADGRDFLKFIQPHYCPPGIQPAWIAAHGGKDYADFICDNLVPEARAIVKRFGWKETPVPTPIPVPVPVPPPLPPPAPSPEPSGHYAIKNGFLFLDDVQVPYFPSPYWSPGVTTKLTTVLLHFPGDTREAGLINYFQNNSSRVTPHLLLSEEGKFTQFVPFNRAAWAAGSGLENGRCLSIEVAGFGFSNLAIAGKVIFSKWGFPVPWVTSIPETECLWAAHPSEPKTFRWWPYFHEAQYEALIDFLPAVYAEYGQLKRLGHENVLPGKLDIGPAFFWDRIGGRS
jgi:N-acetyl-anhydromuramyl-L-alanine amidase AmpD